LCDDSEDLDELDPLILRHPEDPLSFRVMEANEISEKEALHVPILEGGKIVYEFPNIQQIREKRDADLVRLDPGVTRIINPHIYHVSLTQKLWDLKQAYIDQTLEKSKTPED
jgi:nicotinate phosphoribosyltransferase